MIMAKYQTKGKNRGQWKGMGRTVSQIPVLHGCLKNNFSVLILQIRPPANLYVFFNLKSYDALQIYMIFGENNVFIS